MNRSVLKVAALVAVTVVIAALGCKSDNVTGTTTSTPPPSDSGSATSGTGFKIVVDSGASGQTAPVGTPITVTTHVSLNGAAAAGQVVSWSIVAGHGTLSDSSSITDTTGLAKVTWILGDSVGINTLSAGITGATVSIFATGASGPVSTLTKTSPDSQTVAVGGTIALTARAVDRFGNPDSAVTVMWSATGGSLSNAATTTGGSGNATTNFTAGPTPTTYDVTAAVPNRASVTFVIVSR